METAPLPDKYAAIIIGAGVAGYAAADKRAEKDRRIFKINKLPADG